MVVTYYIKLFLKEREGGKGVEWGVGEADS